MSQLIPLKPNSVRNFDELTYQATVAFREIKAIDQMLETAEREIEAANLSEFNLLRATSLYWLMKRKAQVIRKNALKHLELIRAAIDAKTEPDLIAA